MSAASDQRRLGKLPVIAGSRHRAIIEEAVEHWRVSHAQTAPITPESRGDALAAICWEWYRLEGKEATK